MVSITESAIWIFKVTRAVFLILLTFLIGPILGPASGQPYNSSEIKAVETPEEQKVRQIHQQEITELRLALGRRLTQNRRAEIYFRLAEVYFETYQMDFLIEGRVHEKRLESGVSDPGIDHSHSRPWLEKGIQVAQELIGLRIPYEKMDRVYFFLGYGFSELGKKKESSRNFEILIQKYPTSAYAHEAYRELGDHAFENNSFKKAVSYYQSASQKADQNTLPRVLQKLAWSYYKTKQYGLAVLTLKRAIQEATKSGEKLLSLKEEALKDMALFMTEGNQVEEAVKYFQSVVPDQSFFPQVLEKLGRNFERNVEPFKAIQVFETILKVSPNSEVAFRSSVKLMDLDLRLGKVKEAVTRVQGLSIPDPKEEETASAIQNLRSRLRRLGVENHEKFRRKKDRTALELARQFYSLYINKFLEKEDAVAEQAEVEMYLAEVLRDLGKVQEAAKLYRKILKSKDKKYAKEAGALWTASLSDAIRRLEKKGPDRSTEPSAIEKEFVEASDQMQESLENSLEAREASLKAAEVLAGYSHTKKDAIKRLKKTVGLWPRTSQANSAARLLIQVLSENADAEEELKTTVSEFRANPDLMATDASMGKGKLKSVLLDQEYRLKLRAISKNESEKDFAAAAKGYEMIIADVQSRDLAEKAFSNAMAAYFKAGDLESFDRVYSQWVKKFPDSKKPRESIRYHATQSFILGKFTESGGLIGRLASSPPEANAMVTAARVFEGNGEIEKSEELWKTALGYSRRTADRGAVLLSFAKFYENNLKFEEASNLLTECRNTLPKLDLECGAYLSQLYVRMGKMGESRALAKKILLDFSKKGTKGKENESSPYVSRLRIQVIEDNEKDMVLDPLTGVGDAAQKKALKQRIDFLDQINKSYLQVIEAGGPWGIRALDRLARWTLRFSREIEKINPPPALPPNEAEQIRSTVRRLSESLSARAAQLLKDAYQKAVSQEILSQVNIFIVETLVELKVPGITVAQGPRSRYRISGVAVNGGSDKLEAALVKVRERLRKSIQDAAAWVDYGNLLIGLKKPLLAQLAYERARQAKSNFAPAINNELILKLLRGGGGGGGGSSGWDGEDDEWVALEVQQKFRQLLSESGGFVAAQMNLAYLLNYYRIFDKSRGLWEMVRGQDPKAKDPDWIEGLAVANLGLARFKEAAEMFKKSWQHSGKEGFSHHYHLALQFFQQTPSPGFEQCREALASIEESTLAGFEKHAHSYLKQRCTEGMEVKEKK